MITYVETDLFESPAQVLVNTVNTVGVMGKGIAKNFKTLYPDMFKQYQILCENKQLDIGKLWIYKTQNKWVLNFPTKEHWRSPSKLEYIEEGLKKFVSTYEEKGIVSISFPLLGCGNGGLDWDTEVQPLMEKYLRPLPIEIFIHLAQKNSNPEHKTVKEMKHWLHSMPSFLSFQEVWEDLVEKSRQDHFTLLHNGETWKINLLNIDDKELDTLLDETDQSQKSLINFTLRNNSIHISASQLKHIWNVLRNVGFCLEQDLPDPLHLYGGVIFSLLNKLEYIEPVKLGHRYYNDQDLRTGIRVIPYKAKEAYGFEEDIFHEIEERS